MTHPDHAGGFTAVRNGTPTVKKAADAYNRTRLTPTLQSLLRRWLAW